MFNQFSSSLQSIYKRFPLVLPVILILLGLGLRAYHWQTYPFNFDQVQILENAQKILSGHLVLIGPRTGPALLFTGPLIYYLTAAVMLIVPPPFTVVATALLLAAVTGLAMYWLARRSLSTTQASILLALWAVSPFLIYVDRIPWNPNLSILAGSLVFFPLYKLLLQKTKVLLKTNWLDIVLIGLGCFLGYQAHFSGLLLPGLVVAAFICQRSIGLKTVIISFLGLSASLFPTFIFDFRNQWLNAHGFQSLVTGNSSAPLIERVMRFFSLFGQSSFNLGSIFVWHTNQLLPLFIGLLLIGYQLYLYWTTRQKQYMWPAACLTLTALVMSFYRGNQPEYYLLIQVPAALLIITQTLTSLFKPRMLILLLGIFLCYSCWLTFNTYLVGNGLNLSNQLNISREAHLQAQRAHINHFTYDMTDADAFGLRYLLSDIPLQTDGDIVHLQYPYLKGHLTTYADHDFGLWLDPRKNPQAQYITTDEYVIGSPLNIALLNDAYPRQPAPPGDIFQLIQDNKPLLELRVVTHHRQEKTYNELVKEFPKAYEQRATWQLVDVDNQPTWIYTIEGIVILVPTSSANSSAQLPILKTLEVYN